MPTRQLDFPVFDADNHMYETREALTRHLPEQYQGIIKYVEVEGRTKIAVNGVIRDSSSTYWKTASTQGVEFLLSPEVVHDASDRIELYVVDRSQNEIVLRELKNQGDWQPTESLTSDPLLQEN